MRLKDAGLSNVTFLQCDHAEMANRIPIELHGEIAAITFNLGYLPGGDHNITTSSESTAKAIAAAMRLLKPGGILTVIAYVAHPGGEKEDESVHAALSEYEMTTICGESPASPRLYVVRR